MRAEEFLNIMRFPDQWIGLDMYPEQLAQWQIAGYRAGHEQAPEHDRNGAFHWWLMQNPDKSTLMKLVELTFLDPDQIMAEDVRSFIAKSQNADADVIAYVARLRRGSDSRADSTGDSR